MHAQKKISTRNLNTNRRVVLRKGTVVHEGARYKSAAAKNFADAMWKIAIKNNIDQ